MPTCAAAPSPAQDWPTHRADAQRSGTSAVQFDLQSLGEVWVHEATALPRPAWPGPARWDAYAGIKGLASMR